MAKKSTYIWASFFSFSFSPFAYVCVYQFWSSEMENSVAKWIKKICTNKQSTFAETKSRISKWPGTERIYEKHCERVGERAIHAHSKNQKQWTTTMHIQKIVTNAAKKKIVAVVFVVVCTVFFIWHVFHRSL